MIFLGDNMDDTKIQEWVNEAKNIGFTVAAPLDPKTLKALPSVREMCAVDKCNVYGKNWTCPPNCGELEECAEKMARYTNGIIVQTVGNLSKAIDVRAYIETERKHLECFEKLSQSMQKEFPDALCLGAGGCRICKKCAYPEPCRFPERAHSSMEAYGLFVTQVCRDNNIEYYYGEKTIAYTACILF